MKIRSGFVSNSSSSSFIVKTADLSSFELRKLLQFDDSNGATFEGYHDSWLIRENEVNGIVHGFTSMDNGDLVEYLKKQNIDTSLFVFNGD